MKTLVLILLLTSRAFAQTNIIDFESLATPGTGLGPGPVSYSEKGFLFSALLYPSAGFAFWRTNDSRSPGSTALFLNSADDYTCLTRGDGGSFDFISIDLCSLQSTNGNSILFTGYYGDQQKKANVVAMPGGFVLHTFSFPGFTNLTEVRWQNSNPFHQFDNVIVYARPEAPPPEAFHSPNKSDGNFLKLTLKLEHLRVGTNYAIMTSHDMRQWQTLHSFQAATTSLWWGDPYLPQPTNTFYMLQKLP